MKMLDLNKYKEDDREEEKKILIKGPLVTLLYMENMWSILNI